MGGKLYHLPRMPRAAYLEVEAAAREALECVAPGRVRVPRSYGDKPDFGDLDVLVGLPEGVAWQPERERLRAALGAPEAKTAGPVYSMVFRGLQTDLFAVPLAYLDAHYAFMCFNDLGNLLGRTCRRFGLKYGERGLAYVYRRADGNYAADLELTRDFARVCAFLGLPYEPWRAGFGSLEAMFEWVVAGPYFSVEPYLDGPERSSAVTRRARERTTIARFVDYLRERSVRTRYEFAPREAYLERVCAAFPEADLPGQLARERELEERARQKRERFDGALVRRLAPDLDGRTLGALLARYRAGFDDFDAWLLARSPDEVEAHLRAFLDEARRTGG